MNTRIPYLRNAWAGLAGLALLAACDVHEFPAEETPEATDVTLHLNFHTDLPLHQVVEHARSRAASTQPDDYDVRYQLRVYRSDGNGVFHNDDYTPLLETKDDVTRLNHDLRLQLPEGNYRLAVWADYVDEGGQEDKFYATGRFEEIMLQGDGHPGNNDLRDAFCGTQEIALTADGPDEATVEMERPLARYNFVTTDLDVFLTRVLARQAAAARAGNTDGNDTKAIDLNDYRVTFRYTGFLPSAFNLFANAPVDAQTGVWFDGKISRLSDTEAELGFDYVFVNGTESTVQVALDVRDAAGEVIASIPPIDVPLTRSRYTTVRGPFLTTEATGGVGIDPGFDGEWNVEIG